MTEPLKPVQIRKTALAAANYHVVRAGVGLAAAGMPKDSAELKLLKEVLRLLKLRSAPEHHAGREVDSCGQVKCSNFEKCNTLINPEYSDGSTRLMCAQCDKQ